MIVTVFDLINGLPVHPLVVHAAVVLVPLTLVGTFLLLIRRKWRKALGWWVVLLAFAGMVMSFVAKESGEALADRVGEPEVHAELGDTMPMVSTIMFIAVLIYVVVDRLMDRPRPADEGSDPADSDAGGTPVLVAILGVVAVIVCAGATFQIYRVGDSGAQAVWAEEVAATDAGGSADQTAPAGDTDTDSDSEATPKAKPTTSAAPDAGTYTMAQVEKHSSASSCWVAIDNDVYDLTKWEDQHPGGVSPILSLCGTDGTSAFRNQHGNQSEPNAELATFKIGTLA